MILFAILGNLIPIAVIVGIIVLVRRGRNGGSDDAGQSVRRLFVFGFLAVLLLLFVTGVDDLLGRIFDDPPDPDTFPDDHPDEAFDDSDGNASWALARIIVGGAALFALVRSVRARFARSGDDRASLAWMGYQGFFELVALGMTAFHATDLLHGVIGTHDFDGVSVPRLALWGGLWWLHVRLGDHAVAGRQVRHPLVAMAGAASGLIGGIVASIGLATTGTVAAYEALTGTDDWNPTTGDARNATAQLVVFGALWWWYWLRQVRPAPENQLRHGYSLIVGVLGGLGGLLAVAIGTLAICINRVFEIGDADAEPAGVYFHRLSIMMVLAVAAWAVWRHHAATIPPREGRARIEVDRAADYLASWVGLGAIAVGVTTVSYVLLHLVSPAPAGAEREATMLVIVSFPFLAVGVPVWRHYWGALRPLADDPAEVGSVSRRIYVYVVFGVSALVALVDLLVLVTMVFDAIFDSTFGRRTMWDMHVPIALVVTAGVVAWYHGRVLQADRRLLASVEAAPAIAPAVPVAVPVGDTSGPARITVVAADPAPLVVALGAATSATIEVVRRTDAALAAVDLDALVAEVAASTAGTLMVLVQPDGAILTVPIHD